MRTRPSHLFVIVAILVVTLGTAAWLLGSLAELHDRFSRQSRELGIVFLPRDVREGDLLAMCATGAYTYSMAGNYNRFPRPAVVGVSNGAHRLLARRESIDQVLGNDVSDAGDASGLLRGAF